MRSLAAAAAASVLLLAACSSSGGSSSPPPSSSPPAAGSAAQSSSAPAGQRSSATAAAPNLKAQLLTVSDLPEGWAVDNSASDDSSSAPPCLKSVKSKTDTNVKAEADFIKGTDAPVFQTQLGYFGSTTAALSAFRAATRILDSCKNVSFTSGGHKYTGSIGQLAFPKLGQHSDAWQLVFTSEGLTLGFDAVLAHKGRELTFLVYGDLGTPDLSQFKTFANKAVTKMPAT